MTDSSKRKRTSKQIKESVETCEKFACKIAGCGKEYLSQPALYTHKKNKHPDIEDQKSNANTRGRPQVTRIKSYEKS
jgi:hypothetical protein